jgi:hypothetical protein
MIYLEVAHTEDDNNLDCSYSCGEEMNNLENTIGDIHFLII